MFKNYFSKVLGFTIVGSLCAASIVTAGSDDNLVPKKRELLGLQRSLQGQVTRFQNAIKGDYNLGNLSSSVEALSKSVRSLKRAIQDIGSYNSDIQRSIKSVNSESLATRKKIHQSRWGGSDELLSKWYEISYRIREIDRLINSAGSNTDDDAEIALHFKGAFGNEDVRFNGSSAEDLYKDCRDHLSGTQADTIEIFGESVRIPFQTISSQKFCVIAVIASRPKDSQAALKKYSGKIEGIPFSIYGNSPEAIERVIDTYIPKTKWDVQSIVINDREARRPFSAWKTGALVQLLKFNIPRPDASLTAKGIMGGEEPFLFAGDDEDEIYDQCVAYFQAVYSSSDSVNEVEVNGNNHREAFAKWDAKKTCNIVRSEVAR